MKSLFLFLVVLSAGWASPLLGSERCTWGPSYWCSELSAAKECGAVDHCVKAVWGVQDNVEGGTECTFCKFLMGEVDTLLTKNSTEAEVIQYLEKGCGLIPDKQFKDVCTSAVDQYGPDIIQMISNKMDPDTVCKAIGLCSSGKTLKPAKLVRMITAQVGADGCDDCKAAIKLVQGFLTDNTTEQDVEQFIENNLCSRLGGLQDLCKQVVEAYAPELFQMITQDLDPDTVCQAVGFCKSATLGLASQQHPHIAYPNKKVEAGPECVLCEFVMKEVDGILGRNSTEAEIVKALETVCSIMPGTIKSECTTLVDQYAPAIITLLVNELDPKAICSLIGLCSGTENKPAVGDATCDVCEYVVHFVDSYIQKNSTQKTIEDALEKVCSFMPASIKTECDNIVQQYGPAIIQLIAQELDPKTVCEFLSLCSKEQQEVLGAKECTYGPSYWCQTMDTATKCGMVQHCKDHVWSA